jgi:hypothetical protein
MSEETAVRPRPTVEKVSVTVIADEFDDEHWMAYVWPDVTPPAELTIMSGHNLDQWLDASEFTWSPAARASLAEQLPQPVERRWSIPYVPPLDEVRDTTIRALIEANDPPVFFRRGGIVVEIKRNEKNVPTAKRVDQTRMRDRMGDIVDWLGPRGPIMPPADLASVLLVTPGLHLPALDAIVEHPVVGKDLHIRTERGYDRESATYFSPSVPLGKLTLAGEAHRIALPWLSEMLEDFEFASKADKANVLGLMLTPVIRPLLEGDDVVPLCAIRAARAGNGKSLLAKVCFGVLNGRVPPTVSLTEQDEDEADKRLTSILVQAEDVVFFDNVPTGTTLRSGALARALTTPYWQGRIIRTSESPTVPVRCTWVATGNNLTMNDEIARRSYLVELTSTMERPDLRPASDFHHPDLLGWVRQRRVQLLSSLLILVQNWINHGAPLHKDAPTLASYETWSQIVGSILRESEIRDFLGNEERKREIAEDDTGTERSILLETLLRVTEGREFTIRGLHDKHSLDMELAKAMVPFLPDRVTWADEKAPHHVGYKLRPVIDGIYNGLKLVRVPGREKHHGATFRVRTVV